MPTYVIQCENTQLALDRDIVKDIFVVRALFKALTQSYAGRPPAAVPSLDKLGTLSKRKCVEGQRAAGQIFGVGSLLSHNILQSSTS